MGKRVVGGLVAALVLILGSVAGLVYAASPVTSSGILQGAREASDEGVTTESANTGTTDTESPAAVTIDTGAAANENEKVDDDKQVSDKKTQDKAFVCDFDWCIRTDEHYHDGRRYLGHNKNDGHNYYQPCNLENCLRTYEHTHNNKVFGGYYNEDGYCYNQRQADSTSDNALNERPHHGGRGHH